MLFLIMIMLLEFSIIYFYLFICLIFVVQAYTFCCMLVIASVIYPGLSAVTDSLSQMTQPGYARPWLVSRDPLICITLLQPKPASMLPTRFFDSYTHLESSYPQQQYDSV